MRNFQNRVQRLERFFLPRQLDVCVDEGTLAAALKLLSDEDLEALIDASQGGVKGSSQDARQRAAQRSVARAIEQVQRK